MAIRYLTDGYVYWLILEVLLSVATAFVLDRVLKRTYPWLNSRPEQGRSLRNKYPLILEKTKQVFFHRIGIFVLAQTSPLIIYAYASLTLVAVYGNYMLIVTGVTMLLSALMASVSAGVGSLVAEGNKKCIKRVFWELTSFQIWIASVICFGIYKLSHSFIILWVGSDYVLESSAFYVLVFITFISLIRTNDVFIAAYGLFQDIWAPIVEAALNLGFSIGLGYFYGLTGILSGVMISLLIIVCGWKPYFLYKRGFKENIAEYSVRYLKYIVLLGVAVVASIFLLDFFPFFRISNYYDWMVYTLQVLSVYVLISWLLFYFFDQGIKDFSIRVRKIIENRK